jgi:hypothetical protein
MSGWGWQPGPTEYRTDAGIITRTEITPPQFSRNWVSADLGQAADFTALIVGQTWVSTERISCRDWRSPNERLISEKRLSSYRIVAAHRPQLGTPYPAVGQQIELFLQDLPDADLVVDATGVGRAVVDLLRNRGMKPIAISITGGEIVNRVSYRDIRVPKVDLVGALIATAQDGRLRVAPELPLRDVLMAEIAAFGPRQTALGHTSFEGRDGVHDDLVLAAAIGIWYAEYRPRPATSGPFPF